MASTAAIVNKQLNSSAASPHTALGSSPPQNWSLQSKRSSDAESNGGSTLIRTEAPCSGTTSVVKFPSPPKQPCTSSTPRAMPSALRSAKFPSPKSLQSSSSSEPTIGVNEFSSRHGFSLSSPRGQVVSMFDDDPFITSQPSPQTLRIESPTNGRSPSVAEKVACQVANTRSLTHNGYRGPVEVGDFICLIDPYTGEPDPIAVNRHQFKGNTITRDFRSQKDLSEIMPSNNGNAEWGKKGEFKGFEESIAAAWVYGPG
ncbi:hypothetical protein ColLi_07271 [Colletotrichum liriopes]|uniref:Uncharacterized protein n=1 Tax=Colletotrichum liriopes TaxID=708192 RepID=A0AA37LUG3_9PEZI|nr:hypothetical protein ColLi_07271 [Colletotrichum liriopes]